MYTVFPFTEKLNTSVLREKIAEHVFHFVNGRCWFFKEIRSTKSNLILLYAMSSFLQPAPGSQIVGKSRKQDHGKIGRA